MKTEISSILVIAIALSFHPVQNLHARDADTGKELRPVQQDVESQPPVVVRCFPESGTKTVPPGECEIRVTFSKEMRDKSWSWSTAWKHSTPEMIGAPKYDADHKTCVIKVKLEPGKTYGWWLNSQNFHGFQDSQGHTSIPYLLVFKTADK
jgi:hypothetical protein